MLSSALPPGFWCEDQARYNELSGRIRTPELELTALQVGGTFDCPAHQNDFFSILWIGFEAKVSASTSVVRV